MPDRPSAAASVVACMLAGLIALAFAATPEEQVARPKITGIAYVRLYAADLNRSREFYRNILGLGGDSTVCVSAGASCFSVNGRQSIGLRQITGGTPENLVAELAFTTPDVGKMLDYLRAQGIAAKPTAVTITAEMTGSQIDKAVKQLPK